MPRVCGWRTKDGSACRNVVGAGATACRAGHPVPPAPPVPAPAARRPGGTAIVTAPARRQLEQIPEKASRRLWRRIDGLDAAAVAAGTPLGGSPAGRLYRLRCGRWRILAAVDGAGTVSVLGIGQRQAPGAPTPPRTVPPVEPAGGRPAGDAAGRLAAELAAGAPGAAIELEQADSRTL
ncbi:MAG TPA: hypothetical protein VKV25_08220, partial [Acidimicrobiales bacterium]|nr:hypothetical protein [Acidimicrobiales bacterium]